MKNPLATKTLRLLRKGQNEAILEATGTKYIYLQLVSSFQIVLNFERCNLLFTLWPIFVRVGAIGHYESAGAFGQKPALLFETLPTKGAQSIVFLIPYLEKRATTPAFPIELAAQAAIANIEPQITGLI